MRALALAAALLATASLAAAAPAEQRPQTLSVTISGGAALGNYEAGYAWYLSELVRQNPRLGDARIFTGTSAGSANALVALMDTCRPPVARPQDTLGWRLWTPVGVQRLFTPAATTPIAVFDRQPLIDAIEVLRAAWNEGLSADCDAVLGLAVTRLEPVEAQVAVHKSVPRVLEHFIVRVRGRGAGQPPLVSNYGVAGRHRPLLLPTGPDGAVAFDALMPALLASMAFPMAFAPVSVPHCVGEGLLSACRGEQVQTALFQDGGFFDNQPVPLAASIALRTFDREAGGFVDMPLPRASLPEGFGFVVLDHSSRTYPSTLSDIPVAGTGARPVMTGTVPYLVYVAQQGVLSAHNRELLALVEENPEVALDAVATPVSDPPLSELLGTFFGFFDRGLREFDFQLGMRDARRFAETWLLGRLVDRGLEPTLAWPEDARERSGDAARAGWRGYRCLRAVFDGVGDVKDCTDADLVDFRAAAQVTLERLNEHCAGIGRLRSAKHQAPPETGHARCREAFGGAPPPEVPGLSLGDDWRPWAGEDELNWTVRRLGQHGYGFGDLGVERGDYRGASRRLSRLLGDIVQTLGRRQDGGLTFELAAAAVREIVADVPSDHEVHAVLGNGLELGYSGTRGTSSLGWLRGHASLRLDGILSLLGPPEYRHLTLSALVGAEFEVKPLSTAILKSRLGLRVGFSFSTADRLGFDTCPADTQALKPCSNPVVEAYYAASLIGRVRGQFGVAVLPGVMPGTTTSVLLTPGIGGEYEWP